MSNKICASRTSQGYTVVKTLAFLYQVRRGFSPLLVAVSSTKAQRLRKSSWESTRVSLPVEAR